MDIETTHREGDAAESDLHGRADFVPLTSIGPAPAAQPDFVEIRERLANSRGRQYWRSLEELADTPEFRRYLEREFPLQAPRDMQPLSRRDFMRVMGATMALAGVGGCAYQPPEKIIPYIEQPENIVPGKPLFYTTAYERGGYAIGLLGESHMGRPVKLEGNPNHPASLGKTDIFAQASLLDLYDPDRSQVVRRFGNFSSWEVFLSEIDEALGGIRQNRGAGLRILTGAITSPTLADQLTRLQRALPQARIHHYQAVGRDNARQGARLAFGADVNPVYRFDRASRILALDSDFLLDEPGSVRYAREFIDGRRVRGDRKMMNRLYSVESTETITGAKADHRLALSPSRVAACAQAVAAALGVPGVTADASAVQGVPADWIPALVRDLQSGGSASLVIAGPTQPAAVHALAYAMNQVLGSIGTTVEFTEPVEVQFDNSPTSLADLVRDLNDGQVELLVVFGCNPVYNAPGNLNFTAAMEKARLRVHMGLYDDETGALAQWHLPQSHYLETWSDARAYDGTVSIIQPLIQPLYATHSPIELLSVILGEGDRPAYNTVTTYWQRRWAAGEQFTRRWHEALVNGFIPNTRAATRTVSLSGSLAAALATTQAAGSAGGLELALRPDPTIWDGSFANNGWLQELPKPITALTWDNAALIHPETARELKVKNRDLVRLTLNGQTVEAAVWETVGQPKDTVTLTVGYGRERSGKLGTGAGFNAYRLRTTDQAWGGPGLQVERARGRYKVVSAQHHFSMEGRDLVRFGNLDEFAENDHPSFMESHFPGFAPSGMPTLYPQEWPSDRKGATVEGHGSGSNQNPDYEGELRWEYDGAYNRQPVPAWGMVIDLNACIGCNACTIACQAENNIPTVGKDQVDVNREMHWIRIDTYYTNMDQQTALENPEPVFQPVPCMHCEKAPCEPVCPVEATSHSVEGLNEMTYNRCIGTRYCSNNCPYKVRRFNFFQYSDQKSPTIQLMKNPDVTVRSRGVMEKCTYCVQRITQARISAEKEGRPILDGDVVTACQQVCPTEAIIFGDLNDRQSNDGKGSLVRQLVHEPLNYVLLPELNTRPRTSYLASLRNPNPELARVRAAGSGEAKGQ